MGSCLSKKVNKEEEREIQSRIDQDAAAKRHQDEEQKAREEAEEKTKLKEEHGRLAQTKRLKEKESEERLLDEQRDQQTEHDEEQHEHVSRDIERPKRGLSLPQSNHDEEEHDGQAMSEEQDHQFEEDNIPQPFINEQRHEESTIEGAEGEKERQEYVDLQEAKDYEKGQPKPVTSRKSTRLQPALESIPLPIALPLPQGALDVIAANAYKCLQIIKPWHLASSDHPTLSLVIQDIRGLGVVYFGAIDDSILTAQEGYGLSGDAIHLCDMLLDPSTNEEELHQFIVDMKDKATLAWGKCSLALEKFRDVRKNLIDITKRVPDEVYKDDKSKLFICAPVFEDENGHEPELADAMEKLNLTIIDLGALSEGVNEFVKWWVEMETDIKDVEIKGSGLRPGRDKGRVKQVRKIWSDIKRDYLDYKTKIIGLQDHYPSQLQAQTAK